MRRSKKNRTSTVVWNGIVLLSVAARLCCELPRFNGGL